MSSPGVNPAISQIPQPIADINALTHVAQSLKQAVDSLAGFRGSITGRAVTFDDLVNYGFISQTVSGAVDSTSLLTAEILRATGAEATITAELATEVSRATAAETTIATNLATETTARTTAVSTLTTNLATETTARTAADTTLTTNLATETTARTAADTTLTTNLATETTRATAAEALKLNKAGTATNDDAPAGQIGEYISASIAIGSAVSLTTATAANVTSLALTAGDWDVSGNVGYTISSSATVVQAWITKVSATAPTAPNAGGSSILSATVGTGTLLPVSVMRISLAAPATVYLGASATFSAGTVAAYGFIGARRAR